MTLLLRCFLFALLLSSAVASAEELDGLVVGITDGDTLTILSAARTQYKIRLAGIDAPEKRQPFGQKAKEKLSDFAFQRRVRVEYRKVDRYGRPVGKLIVAGEDVNLKIVQSGLAWHYKDYEREQTPADRAAYAHAEEQARKARRGLWQDVRPTPPWDFRRSIKGRGASHM